MVYGEMILIGKSCIVALTFDIWETLLFEKDEADSMRTACRCRNIAYTLNKFGIKISVGQVLTALKETNYSLIKIWKNNKDVTHLNQLRLLIKHALKKPTILREEWIDELSTAFVSPFFEIPPYLNPDTHGVL